jgi:hypothetical protein
MTPEDPQNAFMSTTLKNEEQVVCQFQLHCFIT